MRRLQKKMQFLELEGELRQCGGESEHATIDGSKVHNVAKPLELENDSVAGSEAASGFITPMVSKAEVRAQLPIDLQSTVLYDTNDDNRFDFTTLTVKAHETPKGSVFPTASVGSPVRRLPGEFIPANFQTSSLPRGEMNSLNTDQKGAGQMEFSDWSPPKLKLRTDEASYTL